MFGSVTSSFMCFLRVNSPLISAALLQFFTSVYVVLLQMLWGHCCKQVSVCGGGVDLEC